MKNKDSISHVTGTSIYIDDIITRSDTLHGVIFASQKAHGKIISIDYSEAEKLEGVERIFTFKDIKGENQIGGIIQDEALWAKDEVHYAGQPIALIVAKSSFIARQARGLISIEIEEFKVITTASEAKEKKLFVSNPRHFSIGNTEEAFNECTYIFEDVTFTNGQEHLYLETQGCYVCPEENGHFKIYSSTQGPTILQKIAARVLGIPMYQIEVDVLRLGGGFGGKEDQATSWGVMAAVAAQHLNVPIKIILDRHDDIKFTGKRHPYESSFKIGLTKDLKIHAFEADFLQNSGASADLSPAVAERTLFHATNCYSIKNVHTSVYPCKTNLPPNTAFRGFGGPQGMFVIESAIAKAAHQIGVCKSIIQKKNLLQENDIFSYGQIAKNVETENSWNLAMELSNFSIIKEEIKQFNKNNKYIKKGMAIMPITFGISFTNTSMNHARALVHIYLDGSVGISTAAVEMGQGVNTKMLQIASQEFGIDASKIKIESTNTTRVANTSPSAASSTTDLNGKALLKACIVLKNRLINIAARELLSDKKDLKFENNYVINLTQTKKISWEELITIAALERVQLSEKAHYATPEIYFDKKAEKGHPFAYHVYGTSVTTITLDCIRGTYEIDQVDIAHDFGKSMNLDIDLGQIEGGLVQGIGWMTLEEIAYNKEGILTSNSLSTYKIPDVFAVPKKINIKAIETNGNDLAIYKSKAVGEPPLMYGIGTYFAIQDAIQNFNPNYEQKFHAPFTPEKVLLALYES
ncbi:xanthine dehydrogenase molybdopterin binding subunit [Aureivirga marina]|uniref:xanthine dehydrogenase molybdopterin binding subunit n=1 Tax=Aureivirga marina TaxID=1182451 RepID=UPI0018CA6E98|nr:molybdopterin cofactor-binding domain-containing protein [Aureivirga marina]